MIGGDVKMAEEMVRVTIFLKRTEIEAVDQYAKQLTELNIEKYKKMKLPPSIKNRSHTVSRSKAARNLILKGLGKNESEEGKGEK